MQIEDQIKALQRIKAKIDLYRKVNENIEEELKAVNTNEDHKILEMEHPGLLKEFCEEVGVFCSKRISMLGNPEKAVTVTERPATIHKSSEGEPLRKQVPKSEPQLKDEEPTDPLRFLLKYRGLEGKKVSFQSQDGEVQGIVRGILVPHIVLVSEHGYELKVKPKDLKVID